MVNRFETSSPEENPERKITLPDDEFLVRQLEGKVIEYTGRLNHDTKPHLWLDSFMKCMILGQLLANREIDFDDIQQTVMDQLDAVAQKKGIEIDPAQVKPAYTAAFKIIKDYAETGGQSVASGTGLPEQRDLDDLSKILEKAFEGITLELPAEDTELRQFLTEKLETYRQRYESSRHVGDSLIKMVIVEDLLENGSTNGLRVALKIEEMKESQHFNPRDFSNAVGVIQQYINGRR